MCPYLLQVWYHLLKTPHPPHCPRALGMFSVQGRGQAACRLQVEGEYIFNYYNMFNARLPPSFAELELLFR